MRDRIFVLDAIRSNRRRIILGVFVFFLVVLAELTAISLIADYGRTFEPKRFLYSSLVALGITAMLAPLFALWSYMWGKESVLKLFRTVLLSEADHTKLSMAMEGVSISTGLDRPEVVVVDLGGVNALSLARGYKDALVLITRGAAENLDRRELEALLAHELYHVVSHDTWLWMLGLGMSAFLPLILSETAELINRRIELVEFLGGRIVVFAMLAYIVAYCALAVVWVPLWLAFYLLVLPRNRDILADSQAVMITRDPEAVASLMRKADIMRSKRPRHGSAYIKHMFFHQPMGPQDGFARVVYDIFDRHPRMEERVALIEAMG